MEGRKLHEKIYVDRWEKCQVNKWFSLRFDLTCIHYLSYKYLTSIEVIHIDFDFSSNFINYLYSNINF